jgi:CDP-2,3-bis-(O-geranylgeranyl)-sn-glycerol synthase
MDLLHMNHDVLQTLWFFVPAFLANMTPVIVQGHFTWLDRPLDGGRMLWGDRILGAHKTWRGIVAGTIVGLATFAGQRLVYDAGWLRELAAIDYGETSLALGLLLGLGTGVGDAVKSFFKRRIAIAPGEPWIDFDQLDFMVGAYLFAAPIHTAPMLAFLLCLPIVATGSILVTVVGYELGLKESWI